MSPHRGALSNTRQLPLELARPWPRDLLSLTKPGIITMCMATAAAGIWIAPGEASTLLILATLLGTACSVGSANAFNMLLERDTDRLMERTRDRPLPAGRLSPKAALLLGAALGLVGLGVLALLVNPLSALLSALALNTYVMLYTPLKRRSAAAMFIGAIPGAMPTLIGSCAVAGRIELSGALLFFVLVLWQIPHFLAIALYRKSDYALAGIRVVPLTHGDTSAQRQAKGATALLLLVSALLYPAGATGWPFLVVAAGLGLWLLASAYRCLRGRQTVAAAQRFFFATLIYLPTLILGLVVDLVLR